MMFAAAIIAVLIALTLPLMLIMVVFAVDVAWMQLVRTELRTATDAASRAAVKQLSLQQSETAARTAGQDVASRNLVAGTPLWVATEGIKCPSDGNPKTEDECFETDPL